jgi:hypothetical protein
MDSPESRLSNPKFENDLEDNFSSRVDNLSSRGPYEKLNEKAFRIRVQVSNCGSKSQGRSQSLSDPSSNIEPVQPLKMKELNKSLTSSMKMKLSEKSYFE